MAINWMAGKLHRYDASIFATIGQLAVEHGCVNFGQGFPDFDGPAMVKDAARLAISQGMNQYAPLSGTQSLRKVLAEKYARIGLEYDPDNEITILNGATEAMYAALTAICNAGDEVVVFEPTYDTYNAIIELNGAVPVPVRLHPSAFRFDADELRSAFSERTRAIIVNTPHNPTGRVLDDGELGVIRDCCVEHDCIAITDEVYEHLLFGADHLPLVGLDGMEDRTVTISSSAKTFSLTGWKIGYALAPPEATEAIRRIHQYIAFAVATPLQYGISCAIDRMDTLLPGLVNRLDRKRAQMCQELEALGFGVIEPQGTFFILADISGLTDLDDLSYVKKLITSDVKVATIPVSVFYRDRESAPKNYIRFCFAKKRDTIERGLQQLKLVRTL